MSGISFGPTIDLLKNALNGASAAHGAIANNIANVNTPDFHRTDVTFRDSLARSAAGGGVDSDELAVATNDPRQIAVGGPAAGEPFSITTTVDNDEQMRADGSNVDVDQEMAKLSLNSSYAQTMAQLTTNAFTQIKDAILEHSA